ncbi:MAG: FAD-dependent oxidoreductase [Patescibacteria group bacterium]
MAYDLIIIGADSAGLTAGIYAGRKKLNTLILTKQIGGQSIYTNTIENYPGIDLIGGIELIGKITAQVKKYGVEIKEEEVVSIEKGEKDFSVKTKNEESIETKSVIIATGKVPRRLDVPGEKELENKGVSFCSICDAPLFGGKLVAVIGGGNSGLETAMDLTKYAEKIYVFEYTPKLRGDEFLQDKLKQSGKVEFILNAEIKKIKGRDFVEKIVYLERKTEKIKDMPVSGVFVNIGWDPAALFLGKLVDLNSRGEIIVDPKTMETSVRGIFAAGDVTESVYKQIVIAAAEGAKAALSAYNYVMSNE